MFSTQVCRNWQSHAHMGHLKKRQSRGTTRGLSTRGPHEVALFPAKSLGGRTGPLRQRGNWKGQFFQVLKKSFLGSASCQARIWGPILHISE